jgi:hypothetical protein
MSLTPGAALGGYNASKAGAHQIEKIAALKLAEIGVRVNIVNPDAIFRDEEVSSKLSDLVGPDRMKTRGLDAESLKEYYWQRNLLKTRILAEHVGNVVVFLRVIRPPIPEPPFRSTAGSPPLFQDKSFYSILISVKASLESIILNLNSKHSKYWRLKWPTKFVSGLCLKEVRSPNASVGGRKSVWNHSV